MKSIFQKILILPIIVILAGYFSNFLSKNDAAYNAISWYYLVVSNRHELIVKPTPEQEYFRTLLSNTSTPFLLYDKDNLPADSLITQMSVNTFFPFLISVEFQLTSLDQADLEPKLGFTANYLSFFGYAFSLGDNFNSNPLKDQLPESL